MKKIALLLLFISVWQLGLAQTEAEKFKNTQLGAQHLLAKELNQQFLKTNFSSIWLQTENSNVLGFIGDNYQRIHVKFLNITKSNTGNNVYNVSGKSMVKNNISGFSGTLKVTNIRKTKVTALGVDDEYKGKGIKGEYVLIGEYTFYENKDEKHSGVFNGVFKSGFYIDKKGQVLYDDIENYTDGYSNNQFVGTWTPYNSDTAKRCNWGDYRIPNSGDLDIGAGEFSSSEKYVKNGWQDLNDRKVWWK